MIKAVFTVFQIVIRNICLICGDRVRVQALLLTRNKSKFCLVFSVFCGALHVIATKLGSLEDFLFHTLPMNDQMVANHTSPKHTNNQGMQLQGGGHCFWMVVLGFRDCDQRPEPRMEDPNIRSPIYSIILPVYWHLLSWSIDSGYNSRT